MVGWWREVGVGLRQFRQSPGLAVGVAITIGLGIGANLAVLALARDALRPPMPYRAPDQLMLVENTGPYMPEGAGPEGFVSPNLSGPDLADFQARQRSFSAVGVFADRSVTVLEGGDRPRSVCRVFVSPAVFGTLGVSASPGRLLLPSDFAADAAGAAVLTDALWRSQFGASPSALGRAVRLDEQPFTVVGVLRSDALGLLARRDGLFDEGSMDRCVVTPLTPERAGESRRSFEYSRDHRDSPGYRVIARRRDGVGPDAAASDVAAIGRALRGEHPETNRARGLSATSLRAWRTVEIQPLLAMLAGAAALAFLVACSNAAGLILAESVGREPEFALRQALGANAYQLLRVALVRGVLWTLPGAVLASVFGTAILAFVRWGAAAVNDTLATVRIGQGVALAGIALTVLAGLVTGGVAAFSLRRANLTDILREGTGTVSSSRRRHRVARALVAVQIAVATALAIGAGFLVRSMWNVVSMDRGFDAERGFVMMVRLPRSAYRTASEQATYYQQALARIRRLPGVKAAGVSASPPLAGTSVALVANNMAVITPAGQVPMERLAGQFVTSGYFDAVKLRLRRGRVFTPQDEQGDFQGLVVDETFCQRYVGQADPLASSLRFGDRLIPVIGVVGNVTETTGRQRTPRPNPGMAYMLFKQFGRGPTWSFLVVRAAANPASVAEATVREAIAVDAKACLDEPRTFARLFAARIAERRRILGLLGSFAVIVLALTALSLAGALAQFVEGSRREIAIRVAIGASRPDVARLTARHVGLAVAAGLVAGVGGGLAMVRLLGTQLFGLEPGDPATIAAAVALLVAVAVAAGAGPVWRACRLDAVSALRST